MSPLQFLKARPTSQLSLLVKLGGIAALAMVLTGARGGCGGSSSTPTRQICTQNSDCGPNMICNVEANRCEEAPDEVTPPVEEACTLSDGYTLSLTDDSVHLVSPLGETTEIPVYGTVTAQSQALFSAHCSNLARQRAGEPLVAFSNFSEETGSLSSALGQVSLTGALAERLAIPLEIASQSTPPSDFQEIAGLNEAYALVANIANAFKERLPSRERFEIPDVTGDDVREGLVTPFINQAKTEVAELAGRLNNHGDEVPDDVKEELKEMGFALEGSGDDTTISPPAESGKWKLFTTIEKLECVNETGGDAFGDDELRARGKSNHRQGETLTLKYSDDDWETGRIQSYPETQKHTSPRLADTSKLENWRHYIPHIPGKVNSVMVDLLYYEEDFGSQEEIMAKLDSTRLIVKELIRSYTASQLQELVQDLEKLQELLESINQKLDAAGLPPISLADLKGALANLVADAADSILEAILNFVASFFTDDLFTPGYASLHILKPLPGDQLLWLACTTDCSPTIQQDGKLKRVKLDKKLVVTRTATSANPKTLMYHELELEEQRTLYYRAQHRAAVYWDPDPSNPLQ